MLAGWQQVGCRSGRVGSQLPFMFPLSPLLSSPLLSSSFLLLDPAFENNMNGLSPHIIQGTLLMTFAGAITLCDEL